MLLHGAKNDSSMAKVDFPRFAKKSLVWWLSCRVWVGAGGGGMIESLGLELPSRPNLTSPRPAPSLFLIDILGSC